MTELMDKSSSAYYGEIVDYHFSGKLCGIAHYDIVADAAVVSNVTISHQQAIVTDCCTSAGDCSTVYGDTFTQNRVVTDFGKRVLSLNLRS